MVYHNSTLSLEKMLLKFITEDDSMLEMLKWLCEQLMEAELSSKLGAGKSERLMIPRPRKGGYIPLFVTERKRSEIALMNVIQEAFINDVSTRKIEKVAKYVWLVVSDAHKGLVSAVKKSFIGASWQRCKVHFMRNILAHIPAKQKKFFSSKLKQIWLQPDYDSAKQYAYTIMDEFEDLYSKAIKVLEEGLEDSLQFYNYEKIDHRKISSTNMVECLNREIRRRTILS